MKSYNFKAAYCTIFLLLFNLTSFSQDNWTWLNPKPMGSSINASAYFPGTNTLVAVGPNGLILRSTDHGSSWSHIQSNLSVNLNSVSAVNSTICFIAGDEATLIKTTDAGLTWNTVSQSGVSGPISSVHFISTSTGFLRQGTSIYCSTNAGLNWALLVDMNLSPLGTPGAIHGLSSTEIIIGTSLGNITRASSSSYWEPSLLFTIESNSSVNTFTFNGLYGIATSWGGVAQSSDGGASWSNSSGDVFDFNSAIFLSNSNAVAFTGSGEIKYSSNYGQSWSNISTSGTLALTNAASNLSGNGIILGSYGIQYTTNNFGLTWLKTSTTSSSGTLRSITSVGQNVLASEDNGQIIRSTDAGANWSTMAVSGGITIQDIKFVNSNTAFLVAGSKFYKSIDAGATWSLTKTFPSVTLNELACFNESDIIVAGSAQTTYLSSDGGQTWSDTNQVPVTGTLNSIFALSGTSIAYCAGTSGKVFRSNDKGATWALAGNAAGIINSIWFSTQTIGWAVGNSGLIYKSTNSGTTWTQKEIDLTTNHLQCVRFSDANNGIIVGNGGFILKTTDGGTTWIKSAQITDRTLMSATLIDGSTTLVSGNSGTIIKSYNAPLPVELTSFSAAVRNNMVNLYWETATEIDNYGFEIERKDRHSDWSKIGFVEGYSTSNSPKYYSFSDKPTGTSNFTYRLKQIDNDGKFEYSKEVEVLIDNLPYGYLLEQNYPNPFNPETSIRFALREETKATLKVYNLLGAEVETLFDGIADAGRLYDLKFKGNKLASGFYIYTLDAGKYRQSRKMMLMK